MRFAFIRLKASRLRCCELRQEGKDGCGDLETIATLGVFAGSDPVLYFQTLAPSSVILYQAQWHIPTPSGSYRRGPALLTLSLVRKSGMSVGTSIGKADQPSTHSQ